MRASHAGLPVGADGSGYGEPRPACAGIEDAALRTRALFRSTTSDMTTSASRGLHLVSCIGEMFRKFFANCGRSVAFFDRICRSAQSDSHLSSGRSAEPILKSLWM